MRPSMPAWQRGTLVETRKPTRRDLIAACRAWRPILPRLYSDGGDVGAVAKTSFQEALLHRAARQRQRRPEMFARPPGARETELEFPQRGVIKRIAGEATGIVDARDRFEAERRPVPLGDGYGAVERHDRR